MISEQKHKIHTSKHEHSCLPANKNSTLVATFTHNCIWFHTTQQDRNGKIDVCTQS